jgi:hypothetical protein
MITFSSDADILKYEPALFGELHLNTQELVEGQGGTLNGTIFIAQNTDFPASGVYPGGVIYLRGTSGLPDGAYEIVSVTSATQLVLSAIRADSEQLPIAPPAGEDLYWRISTFAPQAVEAALELTAQFGLRPGQPDSNYDAQHILEPSVLRQASVFSVISCVYAMLASRTQSDNYLDKSI